MPGSEAVGTAAVPATVDLAAPRTGPLRLRRLELLSWVGEDVKGSIETVERNELWETEI